MFLHLSPVNERKGVLIFVHWIQQRHLHLFLTGKYPCRHSPPLAAIDA